MAQSLNTGLKKITESLLLNAYTVEPAGFMHGKAGIALTLFELNRYCSNESIENHAFDLLQEVLAYDISERNFVNGTSGIAYVIHYLIKNGFLDADYMDLYREQHSNIINNIKSLKYEKEGDYYEYVNELFFINVLTDYIEEEDYCKSLEILRDNICETLNEFYKKADLKTSVHFHKYAAKLLTVCNSVRIVNSYTDDFLYKIKKIQNKLNRQDCICEYPLYPIQLYMYGKLRNKRNVLEDSKRMLETSMENIVIPSLDFRQKTDLIFNIYRLYAIDDMLDYSYVANKIFETIMDEDVCALEQKVYLNIFKNPTYTIDISSGISRLVLLNIYWERIRQGYFPGNIVELFN
ncbi:MAG: hypothetical protein LBT43_14265 [Prevotella sp.]|jgi:hypothetical protein|nr:hypothetical protein [Prevotella sp.]